MDASRILWDMVFAGGGGGGSAPVLQAKTAKSGATQQVVTPDSGYDGLSQVTVEALDLQSKTVSPSASQQVVSPDSGKDGLSQVTVKPAALQNRYVSPGTSEQVITPTGANIGMAKVTVYAVSWPYADISGTTAEPSDVAQGKYFVDVNGSLQEGTGGGGGGSQFDKLIDSKAESDLMTYDLGSVANIRAYAFAKCANCAGITGNINTVAEYAFWGCYNLSTIDLSNVNEIAEGAFKQSNLSGSLSIGEYSPEVYIFDEAFAGTNLTDVTINNAARIRSRIFDSCPSLRTIKFTGGMPMEIAGDAFGYDVTDIYVPWSEGAVQDAPWGATNAAIHYDTIYDVNGDPIV